jgi:type III restriction enzyme
MIDGIEYHKIGDSDYEMRLFEEQELEIYLNDFTFKVSRTDKTIYEEYVPLDSSVENKFARDCETSDQVKYYFKLPEWFKIPTPIGSYNPDWAVVFEDEKKVYFVAETKDTGTPKVDLNKLHPSERKKIQCGEAHFKQFEGLEYRVVSKVGDLV